MNKSKLKNVYFGSGVSTLRARPHHHDVDASVVLKRKNISKTYSKLKKSPKMVKI